ncbi:MAG: hypothetical protein FWE82_09090 [Defluviitaleaceae bacterium]|nr:hypothetical protein [Defluviitaleaceae bacterium]
MYKADATADYSAIDAKQKSAHSRLCTDGSTTGSNNCVAYCNYESHPGFLTDKLRLKHECLHKRCVNYLPKPKRNKREKSLAETESECIMEVAVSVTGYMDGMRIMKTRCDADGRWSIFYVAVSNYSFEKAASDIEKRTGVRVRFVNLNYNYEIAAKLVFGANIWREYTMRK